MMQLLQITLEEGYEQLRYEVPKEELLKLPSEEIKIFSGEPKQLLIPLPASSEVELIKDTVIDLLCKQLRELGQAVPQRDDTHGIYILLTLDTNAAKALRTWKEKIAPLSRRYGIWIAVKWKGEDDVDRTTLLDTLAEIMVESGFEPKAEKQFDAIELIREIRD